jgi:hypothetical protein
MSWADAGCVTGHAIQKVQNTSGGNNSKIGVGAGRGGGVTPSGPGAVVCGVMPSGLGAAVCGVTPPGPGAGA